MEKVRKRNITVNRIFKIIKEKKITAKEFAEEIGASQGNITDWKTGRANPSVDALRKISKVYNVQLEWLTGDTKYRTKEEEFNELMTKGAKVNETN